MECGSRADEKLVLEIYFSYDGKILILENIDTEFRVTEIGTWQEDTWYDITISGNAEGVEYSLNGELQYTGALLYNIDELRFAHDNYSGSAFFDEITIQHSTLNVKDVTVDRFKIYPNPTKDILNLGRADNVLDYAIYDLTGKQLTATQTPSGKIDVSH